MNHPLEVYSINQSNLNQSRSPGPSSRLEGLAGMNRETDSDDGASKTDKQAMVPLHQDFSPGDDDVICGRGKKCYAHTGNERFRQIVQSHLEQYSAASSRPEKSEILSTIVAEVRKNSPDGGFVKQDTTTGTWYEVGDFLAREKTSQAFRDALHEHYRSSKKSKHEKRRQRTQAKAMSEKEGAAGQHASVDPGVDPLAEHHQMLYPSPLVSRQRLTVLREEPTQPRAYSFSGQTYEQTMREGPSRAMSLSGRGGGHFTERSDLGLAAERHDIYGDYHRADTAPARYFGEDYSVDQLVEMRARPGEQMEAGHHSWPQPYRSAGRSPFSPPHAMHLPPRQFHPVQAEDVAAHRPYPDTDAIMAEVEGVRPRRWSGADISYEAPSRRGKRSDVHRSPSRSFAAPAPMGAYSGTPTLASVSSSSHTSGGRHASVQEPPPAVAAVHRRADSTASASAIVAHLTSALQPDSLAPDENPFEPIPLGGRSKKKAKTEGDDHRKWS